MKTNPKSRATLKDVARKAGVSVGAASDALRNRPGYRPGTLRAVARAARDLGYRPNHLARQLRGGRSGLLALLTAADNPAVNLDRAAAIERLAVARGYHCLLGQVREDGPTPADYIEDFIAREAEGLVWLHQPLESHGRLSPGARAAFKRVPAVISLDAAPIPGADVVQIDYAAGVERAVHHLHASGRSRIALALAGRTTGRHPLALRLKGCRAAWAGLGLSQRVWFGRMTDEPMIEDAIAAIDELVIRKSADALIASNDIWAVRLIRALRLHGYRVPEDVAVIGFDNLPLAAFCDPSLTTLDQDHEAFAQATLDRLEARIRGGAPETRPTIITPRLILRESAP